MSRNGTENISRTVTSVRLMESPGQPIEGGLRCRSPGAAGIASPETVWKSGSFKSPIEATAARERDGLSRSARKRQSLSRFESGAAIATCNARMEGCHGSNCATGSCCGGGLFSDDGAFHRGRDPGTVRRVSRRGRVAGGGALGSGLHDEACGMTPTAAGGLPGRAAHWRGRRLTAGNWRVRDWRAASWNGRSHPLMEIAATALRLCLRALTV